ncbi:MAG: hypothetical protein JNM76_10245 [Betaproteobacteria bacterium]|nr:hypothetical protein [Betaproteobacteria bacterium]
MKFYKSLRSAQGGFSLIEIMVGALLGLIGTIVIFQVFAVSEEQKRNTTGAGEAVQTASTALYQLQRDAMSAGAGMSKFIYGCPVNGWYDNGQPGGQDLSFTFVPVIIQRATTATGSDIISFGYGSSALAALPAGLLSDQTVPTFVRVFNRYGFKKGDLVVLLNYAEADSSTDYRRYCSLYQVSDLPTTPGLDDRVVMEPGSYVADDGQVRQIAYNRPGGLAGAKQFNRLAWNSSQSFVDGVQYPGRRGMIVNVGALPRFPVYSVENGQLVMGSGVTGAQGIAIADQVVKLKAHLAIDGNLPRPDGRLDGSMSQTALPVANLTLGADHWAEELPPPNMAAPPSLGMRSYRDWARVAAVRLVLVTRGERIRPKSGSTCDATTAMPVWKAAGGIPLDISGDPDWRCYRYATQEMTVPLRNLMWSTADLGIQPTSTP